ncbi:PREDICTED: uncharacterized protein LOC104012912 [Nipponia nippon]|uniref:uncharacterized protein LOC104012912 n=1 Tax=Nipponia nippon TaxID=128390 RepID=UPI00051133A4|nr:PREDICTED: uncharacterized protein LOC104012912 [Nipponia nippon]
MGEAVRIVVFVKAFIGCNALLDLSGVHQVKGTWMGSTTLPCTYVPSEGFTQQTLIWSVERDYSTSAIFRRDDSGDHVLLSQFRDRVSVPKHSPGNASLLIENLEIPDSGHYTCQVSWRSKNNSLVTKEVTTTVKVVKASTSLTCVASGSPPISYRWFRSTPGGKALLLSSQAELVWDSLRPSDAGEYYCEAENRAGAGVVQQSDAVELTVREPPVTQQPGPGTSRHSRPPLTPRGDASQPAPTAQTCSPESPKAACSSKGGRQLGGSSHGHAGRAALATPGTGQPEGLAGEQTQLSAAAGQLREGSVAVAVAEPLYEVAFHSAADVTRLETDVECLHKETNSKTETSNDTSTMKGNGHDSTCIRKNPEYENLMTAMESEYEIEGI